MKVLWHPVVLVCFAIALLGALVRQPAAMLVGMVLWTAAVAFFAARQNRVSNLLPHPSELHHESRALLKPFRELREQLSALVSNSAQNASVRVVGAEALAEADKIIDLALRLLGHRERLQKTLRGRGEAQVALAKLEARLTEGAGEAERIATESAIAAHRSELEGYAEVDTAIRSIDARLSEAQAALSGLKSRIAIGASGLHERQWDDEQMGEMVTTLRSLNASFDEAEDMLEQQNKVRS